MRHCMLALAALVSTIASAEPLPHLAIEPVDEAGATHRAFLRDDALSFLPWAGERISWMFWRTGDRQENRHRPAGDSRGGHLIDLAPRGASVVGLELDARDETLDRPAFDRLAQDATWSESARAPALTPGGRIALSRAASLVTIIRPDASDRRASPIAVGKLGVRAEIRPLMDPTAMSPGGDLPIRVYFNGSAVAGQRVIAVETESGARQILTTRQDGFADIRITRPGPWRVEIHRFEARDDGLELLSGILTFTVPPSQEPGR